MATSGTEDEEKDWSLTGFLFGNINENGELEDESILDEESRKHLSRLESLGGLGSLVKDISNLEEKAERYLSPEKSEVPVNKAYDAADFSEINELADDEETNYKRGLNIVSRNVKDICKDDDYDGDDEEKTASLNSVEDEELTKAEQDKLAMPPPPASISFSEASGNASTNGNDVKVGTRKDIAQTFNSEIQRKFGN